MSVLEIHNLLSKGTVFSEHTDFDGNRTWYPISWMSVSILSCYSLFSFSTHTHTHTLVGKNVRWSETKKRTNEWCSLPLFFGYLNRFVVWVICTISGCNIILLYREIFVLNVRNWFNLFDFNGIKYWTHFNYNMAFSSASKKRQACFRFFCDFYFLPSDVLLVGTSLYSRHYWVNRQVNYVGQLTVN